MSSMKASLIFVAMMSVLSPLLSGCSSGQAGVRTHLTNTQNALLAQGKPRAYVDGYLDGCSSGRQLGGDKKFGYRKDTLRTERDALYAKGWQDGQINCRNEALVEHQTAKVGHTAVAAPEYMPTEDRRRKMEEAEMRAIWEEIKK